VKAMRGQQGRPSGPGRLARLSDRYTSPLHDTRVAARLGLALGATFGLCFATGVWSHLAQDPPSWFTYPARPAGLYRITQGVHVASGMASIPLLLAKLWTVYPRFTAWPPVRSPLHGVERLALLPLVGGGLFLLFSGVANVAAWYPWTFFFPRAHFWTAWLTIGALVVHIGAKATATWAAVRADPVRDHAVAQASTPAPAAAPSSAPHPVREGRAAVDDRRTFLAGVAAASGALVAATAGGTFTPLGGVSVLAQRVPGLGPQGLPVNKSAASAGVLHLARRPDYRLIVEGAVDRRLELSLADLRALAQHAATLPIACVEGWSASARWRGVRVRELLDAAGARTGSTVAVESLQPTGRYRRSELNADQRADPDTLLALELDGRALHIDHGYPVRLIGPNRPGVLQTKWVARLVVT
jgi:Oxidoreductase molybdopterin binding domain